jgi:hypothetical protein
MATRRKYRDGGRVPKDDVALAADGAPMAPSPASPAIDPEPSHDDAVLRALQRTERAEELARQVAARPKTVEEEIDALPVTEHKKAFMKSTPEMHDKANWPAISHYYQSALRAGVPDDSAAMNAAILRGLALERQHRADLARLAVPTAAMREREINDEFDVDAEVDRLDMERAAASMSIHAEQSTPMVLDAIAKTDARIEKAAVIMAGEPLPPAATTRRSMPVSAPVSRGAPSLSTGWAQQYSDRTLTPAERDIARRSFTAPDMTDAQKEFQYWKNRERLRAMRASGEYRMTTEEGGG